MNIKKYSFDKKESLKKHEEINNVFKKGLVVKGRLVTVFLLKIKLDRSTNRVAFTVKKTLYNKKSVVRNRIRRLLREAYRKTKYLVDPCYDIVLLATNITRDTKYKQLEREVASVFKSSIKKKHNILS